MGYLCEYNICIKKQNMPTSGLELAYLIFASTLVFYPINFSTSKYGCPSEVQSSLSFWRGNYAHVSEKSLALIRVSLQIRQA
jgi:hypothetical protein